MKTVRTNISVPTDVKRRMESLKGVNWSALATQAFRNFLSGRSLESELLRLEKENQELKALIAKARQVLDLGKSGKEKD